MKTLFSNCGILAWENDNISYISNGYLGINDDTICYIGNVRPIEIYDKERDMTGKLLMPGLINCHCHAAMTLLRGVGSDLPLDRWLFEKVFPIEDCLTAEDISAGNELAMMEMLASGVTSFSDMYMEPHTIIRSNESIGMKMNVCRVVQCFDAEETPEKNDRIRESISLFEEAHGVQNDRVHIDFAVHAEYTCTERIVRGYAERCLPYVSKGARMQIHLSETFKEHEECLAKYGVTPAQWFARTGLFDIPTAAAHCVAVTEEDMELFKQKGVSPIHNPTSNMKLGSGFAPVSNMLEKGLNVTLGTDGTASNNNLNMFEEMHLAAIIHNGYHRNAVIMDPQKVLKMATINGARLQGRPDTGKLAVGCKADIIAIDFDRKPHLYPALDPISLLVYSTQASDVCMTMVDGRILYENGDYYTLDADKVFYNAKKAVERLYQEV